MKSLGITNLRVLGASEDSAIERSVSPAIQSAWGDQGRAKHDDGWWQPGDPLTGDPPQEHHG